MPPPGPWDLDGELEGLQTEGQKKKIEELLQGIGNYFVSRGVGAEPISFTRPDVFVFLDDKGNAQGKRFVLTPTSEEVGILLYMALDDYHWESGDGSEVVIVKVGNPGFQLFFQDPRHRPLLGAVANLTPTGFLSILGKKGSRQGIDA